MNGPAGPLSPVSDGVRIAVRLTPRASRNAIQGLAEDADGGAVLKVAVTAVPEGGKANAALIKLLSKTCRLPKGAFTVVAGTTDRRKTIHVSGDPDALMPLLIGLTEP